MFRLIGALLAACILTACAQVPKIQKTASGRPEVTIIGSTPEIVQGKLAERCLTVGLIIEVASAQQVTCWKTMEGGDAVLAQMIIGNSYSSQPTQHVRFTMVSLSGNIRIQAYQWIQTQMAMGQMQQMELNSGDQFNRVQTMLNALAAELNPKPAPAPAATKPQPAKPQATKPVA